MKQQKQNDQLAEFMEWERKRNTIKSCDYWAMKINGMYEFVVACNEWNPF